MFENPYVSSLKNGLEQAGAQVDSSIDIFWNHVTDYDVIFFQWPEAIFNFQTITREHVLRFEERVKRMRTEGVVLAYMRHNERAHYCTNKNLIQLYDVVERNVNIVFHMGNYSRDEFVASCVNMNAQNIVIAHHLSMKARICDRAVARVRLGIAQDSKVVLCFGTFRANEERLMVLRAFRKIHDSKKVLLAPGLFIQPIIRRNPIGCFWNFCRRLRFLSYGRFRTTKKVTNEELPYYFCAADVVLIQ